MITSISSDNPAVNNAAALSDSQTRRHAESQAANAVRDLDDTNASLLLNPSATRLSATEHNPAESGPDITDAAGADAVMQSLHSGMFSQSGTSLLAQANLSSESVYNLLQ